MDPRLQTPVIHFWHQGSLSQYGGPVPYDPRLRTLPGRFHNHQRFWSWEDIPQEVEDYTLHHPRGVNANLDGGGKGIAISCLATHRVQPLKTAPVRAGRLEAHKGHRGNPQRAVSTSRSPCRRCGGDPIGGTVAEGKQPLGQKARSASGGGPDLAVLSSPPRPEDERPLHLGIRGIPQVVPADLRLEWDHTELTIPDLNGGRTLPTHSDEVQGRRGTEVLSESFDSYAHSSDLSPITIRLSPKCSMEP
ncbi:hypothetical protein AAE478_002905 [Parahypoxylon ruwenzoriense]